MAEMTTLIATIFRKYQTRLAPGFEEVTPGITVRFEMFYDERFSNIKVCHPATRVASIDYKTELVNLLNDCC